jgi:hypothetical protein
MWCHIANISVIASVKFNITYGLHQMQPTAQNAAQHKTARGRDASVIEASDAYIIAMCACACNVAHNTARTCTAATNYVSAAASAA